MKAIHQHEHEAINDRLVLPSRRYTCESCGEKGRRSNSIDQRNRDKICPRCEN